MKGVPFFIAARTVVIGEPISVAHLVIAIVSAKSQCAQDAGEQLIGRPRSYGHTRGPPSGGECLRYFLDRVTGCPFGQLEYLIRVLQQSHSFHIRY